jgi:type II secretory pathway pseudopilin PulG
VERRPRPCPPREAGFLLVEAIFAVALVALCAVAALAAVAATTHAAAHARAESELTLSAQNVLTDLRAVTAYDPDQLAALADRSAAFDADEPGADDAPRHVHIVASVSRAAAGSYIGSVIATGPGGTAVTVRATLVQEAPAPGSVVSAASPAPSATAADCVPLPDVCGTALAGIQL